MTKELFVSIVSARDKNLTPAQMTGYWEKGINGLLPARILEFIKMDLYRIPEIYHAYLSKFGHSPIKVNKDSFKRLVLEILIEGPRYMYELQRFFSVPAELRREVMEDLIASKAIDYQYCPVGNAILYSLNCQRRIPKKVERRISSIVGEGTVTLYHLSLNIIEVDYSYLCAWVRDLIFRGSTEYAVSYTDTRRAQVSKIINGIQL